MAEDDVLDPKENPTNTGHLPVSGEVGVGPVPYHDPLTVDTTDEPVMGTDTDAAAMPPEEDDEEE